MSADALVLFLPHPLIPNNVPLPRLSGQEVTTVRVLTALTTTPRARTYRRRVAHRKRKGAATAGLAYPRPRRCAGRSASPRLQLDCRERAPLYTDCADRVGSRLES